MNPFREMILLPVEVYKKMRNNILVQNDATPLQKELFEIKQQHNNLAPDQRMLLESEVISKHTSHRVPIAEETANVESKQGNFSIIKDSIGGFAKSHKNRAIQLYNFLESTFESFPKWNEKGELLNENNVAYPGTNIVDLINFVTATKLRKNEPNGMDTFIELLISSNAPNYLLSTKGLEYMSNYKQVAENDEFDSKWEELAQ